MMIANGDDNKVDVLDEALARFVNSYVQGEQPDIDDFVERYPRYEAQIRQRVQSLCEIDALFDSIVQTEAGEFEEGADRDLVGSRIGNFEITEMIGRGGMGVVYLAHDTKLKRSVAVKGLPAKLAADATARMRFQREAELLASLNHPNIAVIHDIIDDKADNGYLVLEYVPGETLSKRIAREPLTVEQALSFGEQIASAISAAHKKGIAHRDLKPGNIKITPDGQVKVLDFGLAKTYTGEAKDTEATATQRHHIMGTPAYMSPEQARGQSADHRTDIWSFGCIMYQMLTGKLPFEGKTSTDVLAGIIEREPDWKLLPEDTPTNIRILLRGCLEKNLDKRLDNIENTTLQIAETLNKLLPAAPSRAKRLAMIVGAIVIVALSAVAIWLILDKHAKSLSDQVRLVVLPFDYVGPAGEEWFADGMTNAINSRLERVFGLAVIARRSANLCKKQEMDTRKIADKLNVDYILDGTVQCENLSDPNSRARLYLHLTETSSDTLIWSDNRDFELNRLLDVQSEVSDHVAQQLDLVLLKQDRTLSKYIPTTQNLEAYKLWMQGTALGPSNSKAIPYYEEALKLDPNFARAHSDLAWVYTHMYFFGEDRSPERLAKAESAARKALKLAPDIPGIQVTMARIYFQGHLNYAEALKHLNKALDLLPNHCWALYWTGCVQRRTGDFPAARENMKKAFDLDPLSAHFACELGNTLKVLRDYENAEHYHEIAIRQNPNKPYYYGEKAWLYLVWKGDPNEARAVLDQYVTKTKKPEDVRRLMVLIDICSGKYQDALDRLSQADDADLKPSWDMPYALRRAEIYGYLGQNDLARQEYENALIDLKAKLQEYRLNEYYHSSIGIAYAGLGDELNAIKHGEKGRALLPTEKDRFGGPLREEDLARIYVMLGKHQEAIETLSKLLKIPSRLSHKLIAIDPVWDDLRELPDFKKLIDSNR